MESTYRFFSELLHKSSRTVPEGDIYFLFGPKYCHSFYFPS